MSSVQATADTHPVPETMIQLRERQLAVERLRFTDVREWRKQVARQFSNDAPDFAVRP